MICSGVGEGEGGNGGEGRAGVPELLSHLVRLMASLSQPPKALYAIAKEEGAVEAILHIFPQPRTELGKITPESVILAPKEPESPLLLGNAARCLMPLAEDLAVCLYLIRQGSGIEKLSVRWLYVLISRDATSALFCKGCRLPDVRKLALTSACR